MKWNIYLVRFVLCAIHFAIPLPKQRFVISFLFLFIFPFGQQFTFFSLHWKNCINSESSVISLVKKRKYKKNSKNIRVKHNTNMVKYEGKTMRAKMKQTTYSSVSTQNNVHMSAAKHLFPIYTLYSTRVQFKSICWISFFLAIHNTHTYTKTVGTVYLCVLSVSFSSFHAIICAVIIITFRNVVPCYAQKIRVKWA